ncbi:MAG: PTS sugar transporter subunit IIB [Metamycoplasmataceae bacterium]
MKILLACSAGMSTSLLEASMKKYADSIDEPIDVIALPSNEAKARIKDYDIVLLGPQVKFMEQAFKDAAGNTPVVVIPPAIYAMAKGEECFKLAKDNLK